MSHSNNQWSKIFSHSSFFSIDRNAELSLDLIQEKDRLSHYKNLDNSHPNRKEEFLLGRLCASKAHQILTGNELIHLPMSVDRSPNWPTSVVGSISHSKNWIGSAVAHHSDFLGVGIDFEIVGRVKPELSRHVRTDKDLQTIAKMSEEELLTVIFSAKESLYKALYPTVKKFFGFTAAAVVEINVDEGAFVIELLNELTSEFGRSSRGRFEGRFVIVGNDCLTVLEIE